MNPRGFWYSVQNWVARPTTPRMIAVCPPNIGNAEFKIGIDDAMGGVEAFVALSSSPPVDGVVTADELFGPVLLDGDGPGEGYGTWLWAIPDSAGLIGKTVYLQWLVTDPAADEGTARTPVAQITVFCHRACPCEGDVDGSGAVDVLDLVNVILEWGSCAICGADVSGDGTVNVTDLIAVILAWGGCS